MQSYPRRGRAGNVGHATSHTHTPPPPAPSDAAGSDGGVAVAAVVVTTELPAMPAGGGR
jgi:hypothetical protein